MTQSLGARATSLAASAALLGIAVFAAFSVSIQLGAVTFNSPPSIPVVDIAPAPPEPPPPTAPRDPPPPQPVTDASPVETPIAFDLPDLIFDSGEVTGPPQTGPVTITNPRWLRQPRDLARYYPARPLARNITGQVVLDCLVDTNGVLNCSVASETPTNWGFGEAALRIARDYRMVPATQDGQAVEGRYRMRVPFDIN